MTGPKNCGACGNREGTPSRHSLTVHERWQRSHGAGAGFNNHQFGEILIRAHSR
jgi:hypothetical protein